LTRRVAELFCRAPVTTSPSWLENLSLPAAPLLDEHLLVAQNKKAKSAIAGIQLGGESPRSPFIISGKAKPTETEK
jgi:hypothetical protein